MLFCKLGRNLGKIFSRVRAKCCVLCMRCEEELLTHERGRWDFMHRDWFFCVSRRLRFLRSSNLPALFLWCLKASKNDSPWVIMWREVLKISCTFLCVCQQQPGEEKYSREGEARKLNFIAENRFSTLLPPPQQPDDLRHIQGFNSSENEAILATYVIVKRGGARGSSSTNFHCNNFPSSSSFQCH